MTWFDRSKSDQRLWETTTNRVGNDACWQKPIILLFWPLLSIKKTGCQEQLLSRLVELVKLGIEVTSFSKRRHSWSTGMSSRNEVHHCVLHLLILVVNRRFQLQQIRLLYQSRNTYSCWEGRSDQTIFASLGTSWMRSPWIKANVRVV